MLYHRGACYVIVFTGPTKIYNEAKKQCTEYAGGHLAHPTSSQLVVDLKAKALALGVCYSYICILVPIALFAHFCRFYMFYLYKLHTI